MIKKCLICGKRFITHKCLVEKGFGKYCSITCRNVFLRQPRKIPIIKNCEICNKEFTPRSDHLKMKMGKFCSRKCAYKSFIGRKNSKKWKVKMSKIMKNKWKNPIYRNKVIGNGRSGKNSHSWKGGKTIRNNNGIKYILIKNREHPFTNPNGYVREHRLVMEKHLGRYLKPKEVVHHINKNTLDNRIENLKLFPNSAEHIQYHRLTKIKVPQ